MGKTRQMAAVAELRAEVGNDNMLVTLTVGQLREIVCDAVIDGIAQFKAGERPEQATLSGVDLARAVGLSRNAVTRLRKAGMPAIKLGDIHRYELKACMDWLREHGGGG